MTLIKICGLTRREDVELAIELGADLIGVVMAPSSPRFVADPTELFRGLPSRVERVAVFGPFESEEPRLADAVQATEFRRPFSRLKVLAIRPSSEEDLDVLDKLNGEFARVLIDHKSETAYGGSGKLANWDLARLAVERSPVPVFLAGGLNPENVEEAIRYVRPAGVDVSSGVESSPGIKDKDKLANFVKKVRN